MMLIQEPLLSGKGLKMGLGSTKSTPSLIIEILQYIECLRDRNLAVDWNENSHRSIFAHLYFCGTILKTR